MSRSHRLILSQSSSQRGFRVFLAVALFASSIGVGTLPNAEAQQPSSNGQIRQVVGKQLSNTRRNQPNIISGGLLGGLFGKRSTKDDSRKATPVPSDRDVDWSGVPYHGTNSKTATRRAAPIRDPRAGAPASKTTTTQPKIVRRAPATPADLPKPPPIASSTPRKISGSASEVASRSSSVGTRPEPLSISRSSRRVGPGVIEPSQAAPTVELVPQVSRRILTSPSTDKLSTNAGTSSRRSAPAPTTATPKLVKKTPAKEPTKSETASPKVVRKSVPTKTPSANVASVTPKTQTPVSTAKPTPAAKTPSPASKAHASKVVAKAPAAPTVAATTPAKATPVPAMPQPVMTAPAAAVASTATATLGEARQAPEPTSVASKQTKSSDVKNSPLGLPTSPTAVAVSNKMSTFGGERPVSRPTGSLAKTETGIQLQPISDRLPIVTNSDSTTQKWHNSQEVSQDTFAPRTSVPASPTAPKYHAAGYGTNFGSATASGAGIGQPNQMRDSNGQLQTGQQAAMTAPNQQTLLNHQHANANTSSSELPGIRVVTAGPRNIMIRQTHPYEIRVENRGSITAEGLIVRAHIPDWADVVGQQASVGDVSAATEAEVRELNWKIERLEAGQVERMFVRLKASRPGTHDLDVDWTLMPQHKVMQVHVQEPRLALTIDGPDEVIYGQSKTYSIRVLNPGDGIAPDVVFTLSPESSAPQSQRIGDIPSGKEAQFEIELTAQDLGQLKIHGLAVGDLELRAEADKTVRVLAADLEAILSGPEAKYQNVEAMYQLEITNHGTAASEEIVAKLHLPVGVTYLGGMEGASHIDNQLTWKIASLTPGAKRNYQFQCRMESTGTQEFGFECKGSAAGQTSVALATDVEAISDLVLTVEDPTAPAPIGQDVTYEIVIRNRGSKPANDVRAIAQFSHGIEPKQIMGHNGKVITGQVLIDPINSIAAGQEVRMKIVAQAEEGGHHRFRTEVRSGDTILVAEEATHYLSPKNERISRRSGPGGNEFSLPLR